MGTVPSRLLIKNGTLIDGSGRDPVTNKLIVIRKTATQPAKPAEILGLW